MLSFPDLQQGLTPATASLKALAVIRFVGLSTTTKPTTAPDGTALPDGSTFDEQDTGNHWVWVGATSTWYAQGFFAQVNDLYRGLRDVIEVQRRTGAALWDELRAIRNNTGIPLGKSELPERSTITDTPEF